MYLLRGAIGAEGAWERPLPGVLLLVLVQVPLVPRLVWAQGAVERLLARVGPQVSPHVRRRGKIALADRAFSRGQLVGGGGGGGWAGPQVSVFGDGLRVGQKGQGGSRGALHLQEAKIQALASAPSD